MLKVSKSTKSSNSGSIFTLERSSFTEEAETAASAPAEAVFSAFPAFFDESDPRLFMVGKASTSRMAAESVSSITIRDVLAFPTMKSIGGAEGKKSDKKEESEPAVKIDLSKVKVEPLFEDAVDFDTFSKSDFRVVKVEACEAVPKSKKLLKFTLNDGTDRKRTILSGIHEYYEPEELVGKTCVAITNLPPRKMMGIDSEGMLISAVYEYDGKEGLNLLMLDDSIPAGAKLY